MKPDIYLEATVSTLPHHNLIQTGFICASLLLSGGWTDPEKVYVPCGAGYAICDIVVPALDQYFGLPMGSRVIRQAAQF